MKKCLKGNAGALEEPGNQPPSTQSFGRSSEGEQKSNLKTFESRMVLLCNGITLAIILLVPPSPHINPISFFILTV